VTYFRPSIKWVRVGIGSSPYRPAKNQDPVVVVVVLVVVG